MICAADVFEFVATSGKDMTADGARNVNKPASGYSSKSRRLLIRGDDGYLREAISSRSIPTKPTKGDKERRYSEMGKRKRSTYHVVRDGEPTSSRGAAHGKPCQGRKVS